MSRNPPDVHAAAAETINIRQMCSLTGRRFIARFVCDTTVRRAESIIVLSIKRCPSVQRDAGRMEGAAWVNSLLAAASNAASAGLEGARGRAEGSGTQGRRFNETRDSMEAVQRLRRGGDGGGDGGGAKTHEDGRIPRSGVT